MSVACLARRATAAAAAPWVAAACRGGSRRQLEAVGPYIIVPGPDGPHHWICDEKNTILLDGYYLGNIYQSVFTVQGSYLVSTLEHRGDHLVYAIQSGKAEAIRTSGNTTHNEAEIPEVASFKVTGYQRALLTRPEAGVKQH